MRHFWNTYNAPLAYGIRTEASPVAAAAAVSQKEKSARRPRRSMDNGSLPAVQPVRMTFEYRYKMREFRVSSRPQNSHDFGGYAREFGT